MSINNILEISRQGMAASDQAIEITSNNIANANTENYSRQKPILATGLESKLSGDISAHGVKFKGAQRIHDIFVENRLLQEAPLLGSARAKSEVLSQLEDIVSPISGHLGDAINNFFNAIREYSLNPELSANKATVIGAAKSTTEQFRNVYNSMMDLKASIDKKIEMEVERINFLSKELASLNDMIGKNTRYESLNELYDKRDAIIRELSEKIGFQTLDGNNGMKNLVTEGGGILVSGGEAGELITIRTPDSEASRVFLKGSNTEHELILNNGTLGSLISVRDELVNESINSLNRLAYEFSQSVNNIHKKGTGPDGLNNRPLFLELEGAKDAAYFIDVNEALVKEPSLLAAGYSGISDNRIALELADLQYENIFSDKETFNDAVNHLVSNIAIESKNSNQLLSQQEAVLDQLKNYREKISGVSLEEEAINLMQFQTVYNASAKAMRVGSELFNTLLSIVD